MSLMFHRIYGFCSRCRTDGHDEIWDSGHGRGVCRKCMDALEEKWDAEAAEALRVSDERWDKRNKNKVDEFIYHVWGIHREIKKWEWTGYDPAKGGKYAKEIKERDEYLKTLQVEYTIMNNVEKLREELIKLFNDLREGKVSPKVATEMNNAAGKVINSAKLEMSYILDKERCASLNIGFLNTGACMEKKSK